MNEDMTEIINNLNARYEGLAEHLKIVEQQISELALFDEELEVIQDKRGQDIIASIGKSVFAPVTLKDNEKLFVDVGAGHFVRKDINETRNVIKEQKERLESFRIQISSEFDNIAKELQSMID